MRQLQNSILIIGLLIVILLDAYTAFSRIHKDIGRPLKSEIIRVYDAKSNLDEFKTAVYTVSDGKDVSTGQFVKVYIRHSYEDEDVLRLAKYTFSSSFIALVVYVSIYIMLKFWKAK